MIEFLDILKLICPDLEPSKAKIHFAVPNEHGDDPFDLLRSGRYLAYQATQNGRNFDTRPLVIGLAKLPAKRWLFAGVFHAGSSVPQATPGSKPTYHYPDMREDDRWHELVGRLILRDQRRQGFKNVYNFADKYIHLLTVDELLSSPLDCPPFPGHLSVDVPFDMLRHLTIAAPGEWRGALDHVGGIYLIHDTLTGKLYIGQAPRSLWHRWSQYADDGHGGNILLKQIVGHDICRARHFHYAILETADKRTTAKELHRREQHWMKILGSRTYGLNANGPLIRIAPSPAA